MEGPSSFTAQEWQQLAEAMPGGSGEADVRQREKLFKEIVVRAAAAPENRFKAQNKGGYKGTLKLSDMETPLKVVLSGLGVSARCIESVLAVHAQAFIAAQKWVNSISVIDQEHVDMNQFHAFIIYIDCYLSLWTFLVQTASSECSTDSVDFQSFQGMLPTLMDPSKALLNIPWTSIPALANWIDDPQVAFDDLVERSHGAVPFDQLADACIFHVVQAIVSSEQFAQGCRKRAFQLLQALNNMPSLPNAVPGPIPMSIAQNDHTAEEKTADAGTRQKTSQWDTSNSEGLPLFVPRQPQGMYAPSNNITQRDLQWRVFPIAANLRQ